MPSVREPYRLGNTMYHKTVKIAAEWSDIKSVELVKKVHLQKVFERVYVVDTAPMDSGMEFQMTGPATEKALSPSLVLVLGTVQLLLLGERSCRCMRVLLTGANISLIYKGLRRLWARYISTATLNLMRWASGSQCSSLIRFKHLYSMQITWDRYRIFSCLI